MTDIISNLTTNPTKNARRIFLLLLFALFVLQLVLRIQDGHNWGGDFSLYIAQGQAYLYGTIEDLYIANKFTVDNSTKKMGPYLTAPGFPILLVPVLKVFGLNFIALKVFCCLFWIASLFVLYLLIRQRQDFIVALGILAAVGLSKEYLKYADSVLTDFPFLFFCLISLWLMQKPKSIANSVFLGLSLFASLSIRHIGIVLVITYALKLLLESYSDLNGTLKNWRTNVLPFGIVAIFIVLSAKIQWVGSQKQLSILSDISFEQALINLNIYSKYLTRFLAGNFIASESIAVVLISTTVAVFAVFGAVKLWESNSTLVIFSTIMTITLIVWPRSNGFRYLLPLMPFILLFLVSGIRKISGNILWKFSSNLVLIAGLLGISFFGMKSSVGQFIRDSNTSFSSEMKQHYAYIQEHTESGAVIGFFKPRVLRLYTHRNTVVDPNNKYNSSLTDYALISNEDEFSNGSPLFKTESFTLYKVD